MANNISQKLISQDNTFRILIFLTIVLLILTLYVNYKRHSYVKENFYFQEDSASEEEDDDKKKESEDKEKEEDDEEEESISTTTPKEDEEEDSSNSINLSGKKCKITVTCD
jgi:hypothetical protein